ncbi:MAG: cbiO1 [Sedimentibacter sp.]|jgi:energy-coupling factor transport system ATP-binding protein|nr:cbiO1 [Sedimentibacter sp.]
MEIFKIDSLSFSYPQNEKLALKNINITVNKGEFVTICGKSGCGKSTILRHLKTCMTPYGKVEGDVLFKGKPLRDADIRTQASQIGFVLQNPDNQLVTDKVWHELAFGLESLGYDNGTIRLRVAEMANFFGIQNWFMKDVTELSGGQKQLLNLAAIMAMQPDVLILDEPTSQLDPIAASDFLETVKKINTDIGTTVILSEHRLEEVFPMSDRIIVMENGTVIVDKPPRAAAREIQDIKSDMIDAMPSAIRICAGISKNIKINETKDYPLTLKEGRSWLERTFECTEKKVTEIASEKSYYKEGNKNAVELKEVWFKYEKNGSDIIKDLSLEIKKGEFHAIVGGNGTGKTTALSLISGLNHPYRGKILINDKEIKKYKDNELFSGNLGVLPQNPQSLFTAMTLEKDLYEILDDSKTSREEKELEVNKILNLMELNEILQRHPYDLSGGEQQKAALAKILLKKPKILLLDEPTKGLDSHFKIKLAKLLKKLQEEGITIVMVSHDIEFCAEYSDSCSLFFNGNIVATDEPKRFFSGNSFYSTTSNKMSRNIFKNAVTAKDVIELCKKNCC